MVITYLANWGCACPFNGRWRCVLFMQTLRLSRGRNISARGRNLGESPCSLVKWLASCATYVVDSQAVGTTLKVMQNSCNAPYGRQFVILEIHDPCLGGGEQRV